MKYEKTLVRMKAEMDCPLECSSSVHTTSGNPLF